MNKAATFLISLCFLTCAVSSCIVSRAPKTSATGLAGTVLNDSKAPEPDGYVYLYHTLSSNLIGPADFVEKTDEKGKFFFDVPEGAYYLVVRKRLKGGDAGPMREGDRMAVYGKNPVIVRPGQVSTVEVVLPARTGVFMKRMPSGDVRVSVTVGNHSGKPLKLLVYEGGDTKRSPAFIIEMPEKTIDCMLNSGKTYMLVVREDFREKIGTLEHHAVYGPFKPESLTGPVLLNLDVSP